MRCLLSKFLIQIENTKYFLPFINLLKKVDWLKLSIMMTKKLF